MKNVFLSLGYRFAILLVCLFLCTDSDGQIITTFAGQGGAGYNGDGMTATAAQLLGPTSPVKDASGNIYIGDYQNARVRKIDPSGVISTVAGNGTYGSSGDGGPATAATLQGVYSLAIDASGNILVGSNGTIRKVSTSGIISTIAGTGTYGYSGDGGAATTATVTAVFAMVIDGSGNIIFSDWINNRIRKINTSGVISTIGGNGTAGFSGDGGAATAAQINSPHGIALNSSGDIIFSDAINCRIRKINTSGVIFTIGGNGSGGFSGDGGAATSAQLLVPGSIAIDASGNIIFADEGNNRIRKINSSGIINTIAGTGAKGYNSDGVAATAATLDPAGVFVDVVGGNILVADGSSNRLRIIDTSGIISTISGMGHPGYSGDGGAAAAAQLFSPHSIAIDGSGNVYIADVANNRIRKVSVSGIISTIAGTGVYGFSGDGGSATAARLFYPSGVAVDAGGNIYIADNGNLRIRKVNTTGIISTYAGGGSSTADGIPATTAAMDAYNVAVDAAGNLYLAEFSANKIRKINTSGIITTVAGTGTSGFSGDGGPATAATLNYPQCIAVGPSGNLFIADYFNGRVRKINTSGIISTVAGVGSLTFSGDGGPATSAGMGVRALAVDTNGVIYLADCFNERIRRVDTSGIINTIAGTGIIAFTGNGGPATAARISNPFGIAINGAGKIYFSELGNHTIRELVSCIAAPVAGAIAGGDTVCAGALNILIDTPAGGTWISSNASIASIDPATGIVTGVTAGSATIMYVATNSCGSDTASYPFTVRSHASCTAGVTSPNLSKGGELVLYPNPNQGSFTISLSSPTTEQPFITITNILGQKVKEFTIGTNKETEVRLNVPAGVYFVATVVDGERVTGKIVVE